MTRIKIDCPVDFYTHAELISVLENNGAYVPVTSDDAEVLIVNPGTSNKLDRQYFSRFYNLRHVGTPSTGVNHIDIDYLNSNDITVSCLLDDRQALEKITASAEFTWIHIMNLFRKFTLALDKITDWRQLKNESTLRSRELSNKKIGIIGLGRIGNKVARYAEAFDMDVFYYDPYVNTQKFNKIESLYDLARICDVISINCYLTSETTNLISWGIWDDIRDKLIVNTSRGEVVNEDYISHLIKYNNISYATDVLCNEQNIAELMTSPILKLSNHENVFITPHVAGATYESQKKAFECILKLIGQKCIQSL